jgi:hypothetical protein
LNIWLNIVETAIVWGNSPISSLIKGEFGSHKFNNFFKDIFTPSGASSLRKLPVVSAQD